MSSQWAESLQLNSAQPLEDSRFHRWYRFVLAYSDKLVTDLIGRYEIGDGLLLDPFCGTGTTLVAAKLRSIESIGIDSNPAAAYASNVKTEWSIDPSEVRETLRYVRSAFAPFRSIFVPWTKSDPTLLMDLRTYVEESGVAVRAQYFEKSGMLERRWMDELPMLQSFALMEIVETMSRSPKVIRLLRLLLVATVQESIANVAFGPELYVKKARLSQPKDVIGSFTAKVKMAIDDLTNGPNAMTSASVHCADSRDIDEIIKQSYISHVITSPPYPTEKDYTRNSRLELVFLGFVKDLPSLQRVKKQMIRSHSKGIYNVDADGDFVTNILSVQTIADELAQKASEKRYGFAKLYSKIITEYFGGMRRHFHSLRRRMLDGGIAAYVVGEQSCYLQTHTPTASLLAEIAVLEGFEVKEILPFRVRSGTTGGGRRIREEVLVLRA